MDSPFLLKNMVANCGKIVLHSAQESVTIFSCMQPIAQNTRYEKKSSQKVENVHWTVQPERYDIIVT